MTWQKGLVTLVIGLFALAFGYVLITGVYEECAGTDSGMGLPPLYDLLACLGGSAVFVMSTAGGTVCISSGGWMTITGIRDMLIGFMGGDKK